MTARPDAPQRDPALQVEDLVFRYGHVQALHGVSLEVRSGELVALIGANGAGKTTLLRAISGLGRHHAGTIRFGGRDIGRLPAHKRTRLGIGHVPEGRQIFGNLSVLDNLRLGAFASARHEIAARVGEMLELFPMLKTRLADSGAALSGGQQQILAMARGLMARPSVLLLDEPSMGLAPQMVAEVLAVVAKLRERGITTLLVEQNARAALSVCDAGYVLESGTISPRAPAKALLDSEEIQRAYLGI